MDAKSSGLVSPMRSTTIIPIFSRLHPVESQSPEVETNGIRNQTTTCPIVRRMTARTAHACGRYLQLAVPISRIRNVSCQCLRSIHCILLQLMTSCRYQQKKLPKLHKYSTEGACRRRQIGCCEQRREDGRRVT